MKQILFALFILTWYLPAEAQKFMTRTGHISFFSKAPLENIEAHNNQASGVFDRENGQLAFSVLMKGFTFEKALMQEHFNENYVESDKFPKATFKGEIKDFEQVNWKNGSAAKVKVEGDLTIHGVSKKIAVDGEISLQDGNLLARSTFPVRLSDYDIKIPKAVVNNIAEVVDVTVEFNMEPYIQ